MPENHIIEWKESWRDEYMKWICGFANAQGGTLHIGKNDKGFLVGLADSKKLMEDIPNKVRDVLGIIVDVNLLTEGGNEYIEIIVNPSSYPVSYKGEYHYRTGSTKQLLTGAALTQFLFKKTGMTWDSVPMSHVSVDEFRNESFDVFREQALFSKRMDRKDLNLSSTQLIESLGLLSDGKLMRAAILLFHHNPGKWINGAYIKIGYFESNTDLRYQDEIHGSLISQAVNVVDLLFTKYLKADITYSGITRIETFPYPKAAIREVVYNAIVHKDYSTLIPIQISVYADQIYIGNDCVFPSDWTIETLMEKHRSRPHNPNIANAFFKAGFIEAWGRGIEKICESCKEYGIPLPVYTIRTSEMMVMLKGQISKAPSKYQKLQNGALEGALEERENSVLRMILEKPDITQFEIGEYLNLSKKAVQIVIKELITKNKIIRVGGKRYGRWEIINEDVSKNEE